MRVEVPNGVVDDLEVDDRTPRWFRDNIATIKDRLSSITAKTNAVRNAADAYLDRADKLIERKRKERDDARQAIEAKYYTRMERGSMEAKRKVYNKMWNEKEAVSDAFYDWLGRQQARMDKHYWDAIRSGYADIPGYLPPQSPDDGKDYD